MSDTKLTIRTIVVPVLVLVASFVIAAKRLASGHLERWIVWGSNGREEVLSLWSECNAILGEVELQKLTFSYMHLVLGKGARQQGF